jgi:Iap family predicted aminopeptidase
MVVNNTKPYSTMIENKSVQIKTSVKSEIVRARNVVGYIEGEIKDEIIVIGAHYDHEGMKDGYILEWQ